MRSMLYHNFHCIWRAKIDMTMLCKLNFQHTLSKPNLGIYNKILNCVVQTWWLNLKKSTNNYVCEDNEIFLKTKVIKLLSGIRGVASGVSTKVCLIKKIKRYYKHVHCTLFSYRRGERSKVTTFLFKTLYLDRFLPFVQIFSRDRWSHGRYRQGPACLDQSWCT